MSKLTRRKKKVLEHRGYTFNEVKEEKKRGLDETLEVKK